MSFEIDKTTSAINMHRGDTGAYYATMRKKNGDPFVAGDVALYTVKNSLGEVMIEREYPLDDDEGLGNGKILIAFRNSDTDTWATGSYNTEIRVALHPIRNNRVDMYVSPAEREQGVDPITATINETAFLAYVTELTGTVSFNYTTEWDNDPAVYGITVTGTPISGDAITVSYDKTATGEVIDGNTIRTIKASKSTITINDVLKEV